MGPSIAKRRNAEKRSIKLTCQTINLLSCPYGLYRKLNILSRLNENDAFTVKYDHMIGKLMFSVPRVKQST